MRAARPERPPDAASWSSPRRSGAAGSAATVVGVTPPWGAFAVAVYPVGWPSHARRTAAALVATERSSILRTAGLHRPGPCAVVADRSVQPDGLLRIASLGLTAPVEEGATDTVCPGAPTHRATSPPLGHRRAMKGTAPCTTLTDPTMGTRPPRREPQPGRAAAGAWLRRAAAHVTCGWSAVAAGCASRLRGGRRVLLGGLGASTAVTPASAPSLPSTSLPSLPLTAFPSIPVPGAPAPPGTGSTGLPGGGSLPGATGTGSTLDGAVGTSGGALSASGSGGGGDRLGIGLGHPVGRSSRRCRLLRRSRRRRRRPRSRHCRRRRRCRGSRHRRRPSPSPTSRRRQGRGRAPPRARACRGSRRRRRSRCRSTPRSRSDRARGRPA